MFFIPVIVSGMLASQITPVSADSNDWVNVGYAVRQQMSSSYQHDTQDARDSIVLRADYMNKAGPWAVTDNNGIIPPSGDPRDYLSWAPYHWPDCHWCNRGRTHLAHQDDGDDSESGSSDDKTSDYYSPEWPGYQNDAAVVIHTYDKLTHRTPHRMRRIKRSFMGKGTNVSGIHPSQLPVSVPSIPIRTSSSAERTGTPAPALAPAKTTSSKPSCTPSPTRSLAPSATWTTCPYVVHDGRVNPDVRHLNGPSAINAVSQATLYNALASVLTGARGYSNSAVDFIRVFFLDPTTAMNPHMNYSQIVRGPGPDGQRGTFTGILDLRGIVKIFNAIDILRSMPSGWNSDLDQRMSNWVSRYMSWLTTSPIARKTASSPNNHLSFYVSQLAAAKMFIGDFDGAAVVLRNYFSNQFLDQIAASGEQPFEAVRTRPYHYRCFNLEAMIVNAKLGDQLGLNFWTAKSKYGATIQTALDYMLRLDSKEEDISDIFPHVAAVAAAYGDLDGKYVAFLKTNFPGYQSQPFWFYDQSAAFPNSPAQGNANRGDSVSATGVMEDFVQFSCPTVFDSDDCVDLEDGLCVSCSELEPFYQLGIPDAL